MNWGIISASRIAEKFIDALKAENQTVYAIASRDMARSEVFKEKYNISKAYGSYEDIFNDSEVDIVYVSNVNSQHYQTVMSALRAGKHVVCEKPISISYDELVRMTQYAKQQNLFLMEALWSRCLPIYKEIRDIVKCGEIGDVVQVRADFSFIAERNERGRLLNPELGGGALYDIGIYSVMFILDFMGTDVKNISASGYIGNTGVDESSTVVLDYGKGKKGIMYNSFIAQAYRMGEIIGTQGKLIIPDFYSASGYEIKYFDNSKTDFTKECIDSDINNFIYEIRDAAECVNRNITESSYVPLSHSLKASEIIDAALLQMFKENT